MNFNQFFHILWLRKMIVLSALIMTVITTLVISLILPKQYVSTALIMIDQLSTDPVTGYVPVKLMPEYMATQIDVIASHRVAFKVVEKLKLNEDSLLKKDFAKTKQSGNFSDWAADLFLEKHLDIRHLHGTSLVEVNFTSIDPQFAAIAANAFIDAYIDTSIEMRVQSAKQSVEWFDLQIASLREHLERAQSVLSTYEQLHGIVATENHLDIENTRLSDLAKQLVDSQRRTSELQSRKDLLATMNNQAGETQSLQEVLSSSLIQSLKSEKARADASFAELSKQVGTNHPLYKQAKAEVNSLQQKLRSEIKMVLSSINSETTSSIQRDSLLAKALAEQKSKVLKLKRQYDEIAVYKREIENAQQAYDAAMQRAGQIRMESEMNQTNISVLNSALPPSKHAKPKLLLNMILSIFLGAMLGVGSALLAELRDRRVRSAFDVSKTLDIPVFAVISASGR